MTIWRQLRLLAVLVSLGLSTACAGVPGYTSATSISVTCPKPTPGQIVCAPPPPRLWVQGPMIQVTGTAHGTSPLVREVAVMRAYAILDTQLNRYKSHIEPWMISPPRTIKEGISPDGVRWVQIQTEILYLNKS